jgi:serine/threonine protein phosphatase 1
MAEAATYIANLAGGKRVWAVASVLGQAEKLAALHEDLVPRLQPGDRLVYLGNYFGYGAAVHETIDELLRTRIRILAEPERDVEHIVYLRGQQEEMWQKLLQLQFAPNPREVFDWMVAHGVGATLEGYDCPPEEAIIAIRDGALSIARFTTMLGDKVRRARGHRELLSTLKRAAVTEHGELLLVSAGIDPDLPLDAQNDIFWWGSPKLAQLSAPYAGFTKVVHGWDAAHPGIVNGDFVITVDGGSAFGGKLYAACIGHDGLIVDSLAV